MHPDPEHRDRGIPLEQRWIVEHREPALDGGHAAAPVVRKRERRDEPRELVGVAGCGRVLDRDVRLAVRLAPGGRPAIESRDELGLASLELGLEHLPEEMVVAKPAAPMVECDDEQVLVLQLLEHLRRVGALEHRVAERAAHAVEHRRAKQELELGRPDASELLGPQVVRDEAVVAAEGRE